MQLQQWYIHIISCGSDFRCQSLAERLFLSVYEGAFYQLHNNVESIWMWSVRLRTHWCIFLFLPWNVHCWMHHVEGCHHPNPWYWPLLRLPAAAWPHHSNPCCMPHAMQSSLNTGTNYCKRHAWKICTKMCQYIRINGHSPAKSFTFTSAPSLMSSLMRRTSPRIAALCSRVSPLSFRLFTLSLVLDAEFGVPFWPRLDCDWCFGVVSAGRICLLKF